MKALAALLTLLVVSGPVGAAGASEQAEALAIALKEETVVNGRYVTLGDVVEPHVDLKVLGKDLRVLRLGRAPRSGYASVISRNTIHAGIERAYPGAFLAIRWSGSSAVRVRARGYSLEARRYVDEARAYLGDWLGSRYAEYEIQPKGERRDLRLPQGRIGIIPSISVNEPLRRRMCVWVDIEVDGEHYQTVPVWFEVKAFARVLTAARALPAGGLLDAGMFSAQYLDVAQVAGRPLTIPDAVGGKRLTKALGEGGVLTEEIMEPLPPVWRGQRVMVSARVGQVVLQTRAIAKEDGFLGDRIRVRKSGGGETYRVRVVGDGMVLAEGE